MRPIALAVKFMTEFSVETDAFMHLGILGKRYYKSFKNQFSESTTQYFRTAKYKILKIVFGAGHNENGTWSDLIARC